MSENETPVAYYLGDINNGGVSMEVREEIVNSKPQLYFFHPMGSVVGLTPFGEYWMGSTFLDYTYEEYAKHIRDFWACKGRRDVRVIDCTKVQLIPDIEFLGLHL